MPGDDTHTAAAKAGLPLPNKDAATRGRSFFSIPPPLKQLFDRTPLHTFEANTLPLRAPHQRSKHRLHIFTTAEDAVTGQPSYNPSCLKWQVFLKLHDIECITVPSNNHASPSGALPFLIPATADIHGQESEAIPASRLKRWCTKESGTTSTTDRRAELYSPLVEHRLRMAWLFQLYLDPANSHLCHRLYVGTSSSHPLVQAAILRQLRQAATRELLNATSTDTINEDEVMQDAKEALAALSTLLAQGQWFFDSAQPTLFDASVLSYTHLLLDDALGWSSNRLRGVVEQHPNLVRHCERLRHRSFDTSSSKSS